MNNMMENLQEFLLNWFMAISEYLLRFFKLMKNTARFVYRRFLYKYVVYVCHGLLILRRHFSSVKQSFLKHWYVIARFWQSVFNVIRRGYRARPEKNKFLRVLDVFSACGASAVKHREVFKTALNWTLPIAAAVAFAFVVSYAFSLNYVVGVTCNGEEIGYVKSEQVFHDTENKIHARMLYQTGDEILKYDTKLAITVASSDDVQSVSELTDTMIQSSATDIVEATGLMVDGVFYGAAKDVTSVKERLDAMLAEYRESDLDRVEFTKNVELEKGLYLQSNIVSADDLIKIIDGETEVDRYYKVVAGDTPISIAQKNNITLDALLALNPELKETCVVGQHVLVTKAERFLSVKRIVRSTYTEYIDYKTTYIETKDLYEGFEQVRTKGVKGEKEIIADISYLDGVEVDREIISTTTVKQPSDEVVLRGTAKMPTASGSGVPSDFGLVWPTSGKNMYVSSYWGSGRNHKAIDIAYWGGAYGKPIVAAHAGTVTYAGWRGSYGYVVFLQSGNVMTVYGHCSKLAVTTGQQVSRGQYIANIGSTGYSTGPHLHFEVRINGVHQNPIKYLP